MKEFEVNYMPDWAVENNRKDGSSVRVVKYHDSDVQSTLINGDEVVAESPKITIVFSYPLNGKFELEFKALNDSFFTRKDFWRAVYEGYLKIYGEEETAVGPTDNIPGMCNRAVSEGPYGIWGHHIGDLYLEGVREISPNKFELSMGS